MIGKDKENDQKEEVVDNGLLDKIAEHFSLEKPGLHNIHLKTQIGDTEYTKEIYERLKGWNLDSNNKGKSKSFRLEPKRTFAVTVYPSGQVIINLSCSLKPFRLHDSEGLINFFSTLGEIKQILELEFQKSFSLIPSPAKWLLVQYDIDGTVSIANLENKFPSVNVSNSLRNGIQIRLLGHLFYTYIKSMPYTGESFRFEERKFHKNQPLVKVAEDILKSKHPLSRALDLSKNVHDFDTAFKSAYNLYEEGKESERK